MILELSKKELPENCFIFKHSTRCPISLRAAEVVRGSEGKLAHPLYWINVVEQRDLSSWVAEEYNIPHESPQLLLVTDGVVSGNWTHRAIQKDLFE